MKAIQVMIDEALLASLDADDEVKRDGRSAVLRRAVRDYLRRRRGRRIAEAYRRGYAKDRGLGAEFAGWEAEGAWPDP
jgi:metal-responsive CopG/Arc/MetJ family transcriptional regulator